MGMDRGTSGTEWETWKSVGLYLLHALFLQEIKTQSDVGGSPLDGTPEKGFLCRVKFAIDHTLLPP